MKQQASQNTSPGVSTLDELAKLADYSLMDTLKSDPDADEHGVDHEPRQVFSGHYVPVKPTPIENPEYVAHSHTFFHELGLADSLAESDDFVHMFSGDLSQVPEPMRKLGWATGYALSIFGTEYYQQCPFQTGNGYGDGRAVSVLEAVINGQRWEMQLKGGGRTPYCRGADGRAVLRSSVREFLAQEHMHALDVPTSRSLSLYVSKTEKVRRPWYSEGSRSHDPDMMVWEPVAISTRVASSFLRVGQIELFGRRARKNEHPEAMAELEAIVLHLIDREYTDVIDPSLSLSEKVVLLAQEFRSRLSSLVANWLRVGYCQGNFNSDNTAVGGFTLDYGPFGFIEQFDPRYQPWTGGGEHFSFFNQPEAAYRNFEMFCTALQPLLETDSEAMRKFNEVRSGFAKVMQEAIEKMFAAKMGMESFDGPLFSELANLMMQTQVDYTIFFRELSSIPDDITPLKQSFYAEVNQEMEARWSDWLTKWKSQVTHTREQMKLVNPKYTLREWLLAPAYQQAKSGDYTLLRELQEVMTQPYAELSKEVEEKYYRLKPMEAWELGGVSHMSCSS
jgi:uncharacterized protein YdiU (UPF0061 family)